MQRPHTRDRSQEVVDLVMLKTNLPFLREMGLRK